MSDNTERAPQPLDKAITITRNGITKTLEVFFGKRDAWKDRSYQAPQIGTDGTDSPASQDAIFLQDLDFIGKGNVVRAYNTILKRFGQDFADDAIGADGTPNAGVLSVEVFSSLWTELRTSAMKLSELNEAWQDLTEKYNNYTSKDLIAAFESGDPARIAQAKQTMAAMSNQLKAYKADHDERKARRSKEVATETTQPA